MLSKKYIRILSGFLLCLIYQSCETEIDLNSDTSKDLLVVYGILDCSDKTQTVHIGRMANPDETGTAFNNLSEPVQSDSIQVSIQEWANDRYCTYDLSPELNQDKNITMTVFGGVFEPFDFMEYKLIITNLNSGNIITAKTLPLADPKIKKPTMSNISCTFGDTLNPFEFKYSTIPRGMVYQSQMIIQYVDFTFEGDTVFQERVFAFNPVYVDDPPEFSSTRINYGGDLTRSLPLDYLLNIFARVIGASEKIETRLLYRMNFTVWAGNEVLRNYLKMASKYEDNRKQFFSNINGGYGLFASSSHISVTGLKPDDFFLNNLADGQATRQLKFKRYLYMGRFGHQDPGPSLFFTLINSRSDEGN